jgi:hypothetical protein
MTWDGTAMDEAFAPFAGNVTAFADVLGLFEDAQGIQRFRVTALSVETPVELVVQTDSDGAVRLGAAPPLYRVDTTVLPVFHRLRMTLVPQHRLPAGSGGAADE